MGLSSSKTKEKQRPYVEPGMAASLAGYQGKVDSFLNMDPTQFVAPESELQTKAFADAQNLGAWETDSQKALGMTEAAGAAGPSSATASLAGQRSILDDGGIGKYLDPATQFYVDTALASYDDDVGRRGAAMQADAAKSGAFGGSRYGVAQGAFQGDAARGRATTEADLRRSAYQQALDTAMGEANRFSGVDTFNAGQQNTVNLTNAQLQEQAKQRALQAAGLYGDISSNIGAGQARDLALLGDLGAQQRGIASEFTNAIPTQLQIGGKLYGAIPPESYIGYDKTAKTSGNIGQLLGSLASSGASAIAFSDRRLKTDIERIGTHGSLPLYSYRFKDDDRLRRGVMADDVAIHAPEALGPQIQGYATVDYGKLGLAHLVEG